MSRYSNISAFMAIGKRYTLDIKIFGFGGRPLYMIQIDVLSSEELVDQFDLVYDEFLAALKSHSEVGPARPHGKTAVEAWERYFWAKFDLHEYHYVERFQAIADLVFELNKDS